MSVSHPSDHRDKTEAVSVCEFCPQIGGNYRRRMQEHDTMKKTGFTVTVPISTLVQTLLDQIMAHNKAPRRKWNTPKNIHV